MRDHFHIPPFGANESIYFCGNSLGLQPKPAAAALERELAVWRERGIEGFFRGEQPWLSYHEYLQPALARIVGARPAEVLVMNTLTVNIHLLMVSFYRPTPQRFKIIMEAGAFPSDQYAVAAQVKWHGFDPAEAIVEVKPRPGEVLLREADILDTIRREGEQTALVFFSGLNYYTGQVYPMATIAAAAREVGATVGLDLAHAAGNVALQLHDWDVDFAAWCSYKYLNSGPGGPSGIFVHERHGNNPELPRLAGWWGHDQEARFAMKPGFIPMQGAAGWQVSTVQVMPLALHRASLELFDTAGGMEALLPRSRELVARMDHHLDALIDAGYPLQRLNPTAPEARGCQTSLYVSRDGKELFHYLEQNGVICDWREDNLLGSGGGVIRVAPTPLYNTLEEIDAFAELVRKGLAG